MTNPVISSGFKHGNSRIAPLLGTPDLPHMQEYLDELGAQLRSKDYIRVVRNGLIHFADYCHREGLIHPGEVTRSHIIRFQQLATVNPAWQKAYQVQLMRYVRGWIRWMLNLGYLTVDPWVSIKIGETSKLPKPLDDDEVSLLFESHKQGAFSMMPFAFHRREMVLCLLFGWGLRTFELAGLNTANMDTRLDFVTCPNKGGGTKSLPYSPEMKRVYQRYAAIRAQHSEPGEDALIITRTGIRMTREQISKMMSALGAQAGIDMNAHMLRDTAATTMLDGDIPIEQIAKVLGHKSTKQTLRYAKVRDHKVAESHRRVMDNHLRVLFGSTSDLSP